MIQKALLVELLVLVLLATPEKSWTFTAKPQVVFGVAGHRQQNHMPVTGPALLLSDHQTMKYISSTTSLFLARKSASANAEEEDEEWDADEADFSEFDDLEIDLSDVDDDDIQTDEIVASIDNDDEEDIDEDDLDEDDLDLDEWDDDDEEEDDDDDSEAEYVVYEEEPEESDVTTVGGGAKEWDDDGEEDIEYELEDDTEDPDYQAQKDMILEALARRDELRADESFDAFDYIANQLSDDEIDALDNDPVNIEMEERFKAMGADRLDEEALADVDLEAEVMSNDADDYEPYESVGEDNVFGNGISDDDLTKLDNTWKELSEIEKKEKENPMMSPAFTRDFDFHDRAIEEGRWSNQTLEEWDNMTKILDYDTLSYDWKPWLDYDLDFNVSNLILAAVKHNREAPLLLQHWFPQLQVMERYAHARERDFDFTWEDVENADISELERYYAGFGYDEIPTKLPGETGIIQMEELDEDEIKMAAFDTWMKEVYNPEWDRKDLDDDDLQDEDNVFSNFYEHPQHPDLPTFDEAREDISQWEEEMGDDLNEVQEKYRDMVGKEVFYQIKHETEQREEFRGHLVVACSPMDSDLEIAEKLTARMAEEFGKQIYVETRVMGHAREDDDVFEIWLESYEIDLLHSKKRASSNTADWDGPAVCDDKQIDFLVERVRELTSDDARYSYRMVDHDLPV